MSTLALRLSTVLIDGTEVYQETTLDRTLYSDAILLMLYAKLSKDFDAYVASQVPRV